MSVTIYTKPDCPACDATKLYMDKFGIAYVVENYADSAEAKRLAAFHSFRAAPLVVAGSDCWAGFRIDKIKELGGKRPNLTEADENAQY